MVLKIMTRWGMTGCSPLALGWASAQTVSVKMAGDMPVTARRTVSESCILDFESCLAMDDGADPDEPSTEERGQLLDLEDFMGS